MEREQPEKDFDQALQDIRESNPKRFDDGYKHCTFDPSINPVSEQNQARTYNDLLKWGDEKRLKLANRRMQDLEEDSHPFKPEINYNSVKMVGNRSGNVEDRLLKSGKQYEEKLENRLKIEEKEMFRP